MMRFIVGTLLVLTLSTLPALGAEFVLIQTSLGDIKVELDREKAPVSVTNFLTYVEEGFYDGTVFHRVIRDFMIQGGGFAADLTRKVTHDPIVNEATNGLKNLRGTLAMARTNVINSATSQFFINHKDNPSLDHRGTSAGAYGYAVFGKVVEGLSVVDAIANQKTRPLGGQFKDMPADAVTIKQVTYLKTDS